MSEVVAHAPGTFCWIELGTIDAAAAKAFYTQLFGWSFTDESIGPDGFYTRLQKNGHDVGALYELTEGQRARAVPPHWFPYLAVENVDVAAKQAAALQGTVLNEPFDVMQAGRMAVVQDPTGASFGLWQARDNIGAEVVGEPGSLCWTELATRDADAAGAFYTGLFGWGTQVQQMEMGPYTTFLRGEHPAGGMMQMTEAWGDLPSHWMPYFGVTDCDATAARANELGGRVDYGPHDIPDVGRFALLIDPQGAAFMVITLHHFG